MDSHEVNYIPNGHTTQKLRHCYDVTMTLLRRVPAGLVFTSKYLLKVHICVRYMYLVNS